MSQRFVQKINGFAYGYSDIEIRLDNTIFDEIEDISYDASIERGELKGTAPVPQGFTQGNVSFKGSMTMSKAQAVDFKKQLGTFGNTQFDIVVTYGPVPRGDGTFMTVTDTLYGCLLNTIGNSHTRGDALKEKFDLVIMNIDYDGASAY